MKKPVKKGRFIFLSILGLFAILVFIGFLINVYANIRLITYINSFDKVEYENQLVPTVEEEGYYTFRTDNDLNVMVISDIHLGGGKWSMKNDRKTVYEVMTMVQEQKPDLVILDGDQIFACPGPVFNGGGTFNNKKVEKRIIQMFETLGVYFTVTFGNHDTESFDYSSREAIGKLYMKDKYQYCIFNSDFSGYGVSNQAILVKNNDGKIRKVLMVIDSNAYINNSLSATINWQYDTINDSQVEWAKGVIQTLSGEGETLKSLFFFHIPIGEFETAYCELVASNFADTANAKYVSGVWDEEINETLGGRVWYGGCSNLDVAPENNDKLFEVLGPDGINSMEACFVGHDHTNNAVVYYKGVMLAYNNSIDNSAYDDIAKFGVQRGATVITIHNDGTWTQTHKNAYTDYHCDPNKFYNVNTKDYYMDGELPKN